MLYVGIVIAAAVGLVVYSLLRGKRSAGGGRSKVVSIQQARKRRGKQAGRIPGAKLQPCSLCRKPSAKLIFVSDETGGVIGVCKACRPKIKSRELDRL